MSNYVKEYTDSSLLYNYIEVIRYLTTNVYATVFEGDLELSCWSFIKEDYGVVQEFLNEYDAHSKQIIEQVGEADEDESMGVTLADIKASMIGKEDPQPIKIKLTTPDKLVIDV